MSSKQTLLIAEDSGVNQNILEGILSQQDNIVKAHNGNVQYELALTTFVKQNSEILEEMILSIEYARELESVATYRENCKNVRRYMSDDFVHSVDMLTKVLNENTLFKHVVAQIAVYQAIITTVLNEWKLDFNQLYPSFCEKANFSDKNESIYFFARDFDKETSKKRCFHLFYCCLM